MKLRTSLIPVILLLPLLLQCAVAAEVDLAFEVQEGGDGFYYHANLEDPNSTGYISLEYHFINNTLFIYEVNIESVTLYLNNLLGSLEAVASSGIRAYLTVLGGLNIKFRGNGTNTYAIMGVPEVIEAYLDGVKWSGYTYDNKTIEFQLDMSDHDVELVFEMEDEIIPWVFLLTLVVIIGVGFGVAIFIMGRMG